MSKRDVLSAHCPWFDRGIDQVHPSDETYMTAGESWAIIRKVHINLNESGWTGLRNFLRPYRVVHKAYLSNYDAIHELAVDHKRMSPGFLHASSLSLAKNPTVN